MSESSYQQVLVTGASSGIGRGLASFFARRGARVYAAARREEALKSLREELRAEGATVEPFPLDVSLADETLERIRALDERCGGLDLVIANAGIGRVTDGRALSWKDVEDTVAVNVSGAAATLCAALPGMVARGRGHLVGVSSLAAHRGLPKTAAYSASKAFLSTFLEGLRVDLAGTGVRVTCLEPGFVKSEMTSHRRPSAYPFLLETDAACARMGKAILRGVSLERFPFPTSSLVRLLSALPNAAYDGVIRRRRR